MKAKTSLYFLFIVISIFFMDIVFRFATVNKSILVSDLFLSYLFLLTIILVFFLGLSFLPSMARYICSIVLLALIAFIYSSQLVYYKAFKMFFTVYSLGNGAQITEFWREIVAYVQQNILWILFLFFPVLFFAIFGRKIFAFEKISGIKKGIIAGAIVLTYAFSLVGVHTGEKGQHSAYDLYYKSNFPLLSVERLGLLTTMRIDFQRLVTNWSPTLDVPVVIPEKPQVGGNVPEEDETPLDEDPVQDPEVEEEPEVIEYNVMEIDFDKLIEEESNEEIKEMHRYFQSVEPTAKNDYTGIYEGYNLILLTAEGFAPYAVHPEVTPTLYKLVNEGYQFTNFYTPIWEVSTSDGEYVAMQGLIPKSGLWSFRESGKNKLPFVLGNQLKKLGYKTMGYHNHTYTYYGRDISHPNLGYEYKGLGNGLDVRETWPESDLEMMEKTIEEYIHDEPFHAYYMTVSGHLLYNFTGNYIAYKNRDVVEDLSMSEQAKAYLATQVELDRALEYLLDKLEEAGIAEKTLIALSADHYPYGLEEETISEFLGHQVETNFELYKNTFILYTKGMEPEVITKPASSLDILPTISNLLGLEYDSRLLMGRDIFSDSPPIVPFLNRSFITDKGKYNAVTREFTPFEGEEVDQEYIDYISSVVKAKFYYSAKILENNYYEKISKE